MRILMSMFGWNDVGGGTSYPRQVAVNLTRLGHEVCVFYAAVPTALPPGPPAQHRLVQHSEDGVSLVAVTDRPTLFLDNRQPLREVRHAGMVESFRQVFAAFRPDIVHYHNFLGLSEGIAEVAHAAGVPSLFSAHQFWMICPNLYLYLPNGELCGGVNADGSNCQAHARAEGDFWTPYLPPAQDYVTRRDLLRQGFESLIDLGLVNSGSVKQQFLKNGYAPERIEVLKLSNPRAAALWEALGKDRSPTQKPKLTIGFIGQVIPIKGVHTLVRAAQLLRGDFEVQIHGMTSPDYLQELQALDQRGVVSFHGTYGAADQLRILSGIDIGVVTSIWFDHSPLVITEFHSARIPVLGADIGGIPDYLQPEASLRFPAGDAVALAAMLQDLLDDRPRLEAMKAAIVRPPGPEVYLEGVLARYERLLNLSRDPASPHFARRVGHWLTQRAATGDRAYGALSLQPLAGQDPPPEGYGLDIHSLTALQALAPDRLSMARWIVSPLAEIVSALQARGLSSALLPLSPSPAPQAGEAALPETSLPPVLIPLAADGAWQQALAACLEPDSPAMTPMLLPWGQSLEAAQDELIEHLEAQGIDLETAPEMVLLESEGEASLEAIFAQADLCLLPALPDAHLRRLAALSPLIASPLPPEALSGLLTPAPAAEPWQSLAARLGASLYRPAATSDAGARFVALLADTLQA